MALAKRPHKNMVIFLKGQAYAEALEAFYRNSDEGTRAKQRLRNLLPNVIRELLIYNKGCLNVLGVGTGDGENDLEVLEIIKAEQLKNACDVRISEHALDPNQSQLDRMKASTKYQNLVQDGNVEMCLSSMTFQEYMETNTSKNHFDLVHFILSLFNMGDIEGCLLYTYQHLIHDKGKIIIVVTGDDVVSWAYHRQSHLWTDEAHFPIVNGVANQIRNIAEKYDWKYELHIDEYELDIAKVFDEQSSEGSLILDCLTYIQDFRTSVDRKQVDETIELLRRNVTVERDGKCLCKRNFQFLVISK